MKTIVLALFAVVLFAAGAAAQSTVFSISGEVEAVTPSGDDALVKIFNTWPDFLCPGSPEALQEVANRFCSVVQPGDRIELWTRFAAPDSDAYALGVFEILSIRSGPSVDNGAPSNGDGDEFACLPPALCECKLPQVLTPSGCALPPGDDPVDDGNGRG